MSKIMHNLEGTTNPYYRIGKRGVVIYQDYDSPVSSLGNNGDVFFGKSDNSNIFRKENNVWTELGTKKVDVTSTDVTYIMHKPETVLLVDCSLNSVVVTLDDSSANIGYSINIKDAKGASETNTITINSNTSTIDEKSAAILNINRGSLTLVFDGSGWVII